MKLYAQIRKIDEDQRMVWGVASSESVDSDGEVVTKQAMQDAWDNYMKFANVREMHQPSAVGVVKEYSFDDNATNIGVYVVDDMAWKKVKEGVYKGFSIGGRKLPGGYDPATKTISALDLVEISLVDRPANPEALIQMFKMEGGMGDNVSGEVVTLADPVATQANALGELLEKWSKDPKRLLELARQEIADIEKKKKAEEDEGKYGDVEYADTKNKKYPIDTEEHIRAAWSYINQEKNQKDYTAAEVEKIKDKIIAAWKKEIGKDGPPSAKEDEAEKSIKLRDILKALGSKDQEQIKKGMYGIASFAGIIEELSWLQQSCEYEAQYEGDGSDMPAKIAAAVKVLGALLVQMAQEEVSELGTPDGDADPLETLSACIQMADTNQDIKKSLSILSLYKAGARNSAVDQERLQSAHDLLNQLGAVCSPDESGGSSELQAGAVNTANEPYSAVKHEHTHDIHKMGGLVETLSSDISKIRKELVKLREENDRLAKAHAALAAQPVTPKAALKVVEKGQDHKSVLPNNEVAPVLKNDGTVDVVMTEIKKAHANGPQGLSFAHRG